MYVYHGNCINYPTHSTGRSPSLVTFLVRAPFPPSCQKELVKAIDSPSTDERLQLVPMHHGRIPEPLVPFSVWREAELDVDVRQATRVDKLRSNPPPCLAPADAECGVRQCDDAVTVGSNEVLQCPEAVILAHAMVRPCIHLQLKYDITEQVPRAGRSDSSTRVSKPSVSILTTAARWLLPPKCFSRCCPSARGLIGSIFDFRASRFCLRSARVPPVSLGLAITSH